MLALSPIPLTCTSMFLYMYNCMHSKGVWRQRKAIHKYFIHLNWYDWYDHMRLILFPFISFYYWCLTTSLSYFNFNNYNSSVCPALFESCNYIKWFQGTWLAIIRLKIFDYLVCNWSIGSLVPQAISSGKQAGWVFLFFEQQKLLSVWCRGNVWQ